MKDDCVSPSGQPAECNRSRCVVGACHPPTEPPITTDDETRCMSVANYTSDHDEFLMRHAEHENSSPTGPLP